MLEGRRYSEGLHQAIEAKEGVRIKEENQTLATITIQNYFQMYDKLAGMTGTAKTQLTEFEETYKIGVVEIPTNRPNVRDDEQDLIYKTEDEKWNAVADDIIAAQRATGQPVLVGTVSIEKSERLSGVLNRRGIAHNVLNAKNHEKEARDRRAGGPERLGHGRDEHGRPRRRHPAGRQPGVPRPPGDGRREWDNDRYLLFEMDDGGARRLRGRIRADLRQVPRPQTDAGARRGRGTGRPLRPGHRARTSRAGSTTSCAAGRAARATRASRCFYLSLEDDLMRMFASDRVGSDHGPLQVAGGRADRGEDGDAGRRERPEADRGARTTSDARTSSSTTR